MPAVRRIMEILCTAMVSATRHGHTPGRQAGKHCGEQLSINIMSLVGFGLIENYLIPEGINLL